MRRREFITLLGGGGAVTWPLGARGQQASKLPTIGLFSPNTLSAASPWTAAFVRRLGELGWIEGRTVTIEYRWGDGRTDRIAEFLTELVQLRPDVIVTHGQPNIVAANTAPATGKTDNAARVAPLSTEAHQKAGNMNSDIKNK